jgi:hypothetical protein
MKGVLSPMADSTLNETAAYNKRLEAALLDRTEEA